MRIGKVWRFAWICCGCIVAGFSAAAAEAGLRLPRHYTRHIQIRSVSTKRSDQDYFSIDLAGGLAGDRHRHDVVHANDYRAVDAKARIRMQDTPPNMVLISLALFLTLFTMAPAFEDITATAISR